MAPRSPRTLPMVAESQEVPRCRSGARLHAHAERTGTRGFQLGIRRRSRQPLNCGIEDSPRCRQHPFSADHLGPERTPAVIRVGLPAPLLRMLLSEGLVIAFTEQFAVVGPSPGVVGQHGMRLVDDTGVPIFTPQVRMFPELLHQRTVAGTDKLARRIRLHIQDSVIIALVFQESILIGPTPLCVGRTKDC